MKGLAFALAWRHKFAICYWRIGRRRASVIILKAWNISNAKGLSSSSRDTPVPELRSYDTLAINYSRIMSWPKRALFAPGEKELLRVGSFFLQRAFSASSHSRLLGEAAAPADTRRRDDSTRKFAVLSEIHTRGGPRESGRGNWTNFVRSTEFGIHDLRLRSSRFILVVYTMLRITAGENN